MTTTEDILRLCRKLHPWRPDDHTLEIIAFAEQNQIPFCEECADWHHPDEEHSAVTE